MSALSGIGWFDVEGLEHESEQMIPVIERKVLDQSGVVAKINGAGGRSPAILNS